ncbi:MAG: dephospho-CoA kinase [Ornithinimicrobium sp.]
MLRVGLSGGIGSGKSTVAEHLVSRGAFLVDSDAIAREVVAPGTLGLAEIVEAFGDRVLTGDGALDRPVLGAMVFADGDSRRRLESITHPRIAARTAELIAGAPGDAVVLHDVPLLVEKAMGPAYHLVVIVGTDQDERLRRLVDQRGMDPEDARSRIRSQAQDEERRAAADVWLPNDAGVADLLLSLDALWDERILPFERNVRDRRPAPRPDLPTIHPPDPTWPAQAERLMGRVRHVLGERAVAVEHVGSTAVADLPARDEIDLQVAVRSLGDVDAADVQHGLAAAGFVSPPDAQQDQASGLPAAAATTERLLLGADPHQLAQVHLRAADSDERRQALLVRDWLRATPSARGDYAALKASSTRAGRSGTDYLHAKQEWSAKALVRAQQWASKTRWSIS